MSFTWPEITFTGAEVEAFVTAYKELAESIYDDYANLSAPTENLLFPYKNPNNIKEFLTSALLYSSFVVKQRAGNSGDGTDFDLSNSPLNLPLSNAEIEKIFSNLGCNYTLNSILCSWNKNKEKDPTLEKYDDLVSEFLDDVIYDPTPDCETFEDKLSKWNPYPNNTDWWRRILDFANQTIGYSPDGVGAAVRGAQRYAYGSGGRFTENDLNPGQLNNLRETAQNAVNNKQKTDVTNQKTDEQKSKLGASPTDKIYQINFVGTTWTLFIGNATVITDSDNNVKYIKDDFDFEYGWVINRNDGSQPGNSFSDDMIEDGSGWQSPTTTPCEAIGFGAGPTDPFGRFIRSMPAQMHGQGSKGSWSGSSSGKPFTVDINLQ
jgi:hypothetical protein